MQLPDLRTREAKAAQRYMSHKGYRHLRPRGVIGIEDDHCWYFYYDLPEGALELEVSLNGDDWRCVVTSFQLIKRPAEVRKDLALAG